MKRSILLGIVGVAAAMATSSYGQGFITLDNYISSSSIPSPIKIGGVPVSAPGYTVSMYIAAGNILGSIGADPIGNADPTGLNAGFSLASGGNSTAALAGAAVFGNPGAYISGGSYQPGMGAGATITVMVVAYDGANYAASANRGHSAGFLMVTSTGVNQPQITGSQETDGGFNVVVPEPTTLALGGLGGLALLFLRRKQA